MSETPATPASPLPWKIGNDRLCRVTEAAATHLLGKLAKQGRQQGALRIAVIGGGCSGLQYEMDLVDGPKEKDILVESRGVRIVVAMRHRDRTNPSAGSEWQVS